MSSLNLKTLQVGTSPTSAENYHWTSDGAGSLSLNRGHAGTVEANILSVDSSNNVTVPGAITFNGSVSGVTPLTSESTKAATTAYVTNKANSFYYYKQITGAQSVATNGSRGTALAFDTAGNLYWAVTNEFNGTTRNVTAYVYKITPTGAMTTFASTLLTNGALETALAFDAAGNLYWAIVNGYTGSSYSTTSYVFKITAGGTLTTFASVATLAGAGTCLVFDTAGNLFWAVANNYNGTSYNQTSYVYKITPAGGLTTFASVATNGGLAVRLVFDSSGNLYWAVSNSYNGTTGNLTSYIYKITAGGTMTTFASVTTDDIFSADIKFDAAGNLYWAIANSDNSGAFKSISYVYKITPAGAMTTFASAATNDALGTRLVFDSAGNLYWAIANRYNGSIWNNQSYIYKITSAGSLSILAGVTSIGGFCTDLAFDTAGNLYWPVTNSYDGATWNQTSYLHALYKTPVK